MGQFRSGQLSGPFSAACLEDIAQSCRHVHVPCCLAAVEKEAHKIFDEAVITVRWVHDAALTIVTQAASPGPAVQLSKQLQKLGSYFNSNSLHAAAAVTPAPGVSIVKHTNAHSQRCQWKPV